MNNYEYFEGMYIKCIEEADDSIDEDINRAEGFFRKHFFSITTGKQALDIGCSNGVAVKALSNLGFTVTGIDFSPTAVSIAQKMNPSARIENCRMDDINRLNISNVDLVNCTGDTLLYNDTLDEVDDLLKQCNECMNIDGVLIIEYRDFCNRIPIEDRIVLKNRNGCLKILCLIYENDFVYTIDTYLDNEFNLICKEVNKKLIIPESKIQELLRKNGFGIDSIEKYNNKMIIKAIKLS